MIYQFLTLQLIAHLLSDFVFQPNMWSLKKKGNIITWHHLWHVIVVFLFTYLFSFDYFFWKYAILLVIIHLATDIFKSTLQLNSRLSDSFLFFTDQIIHLIFIVLICILYDYFSGIHFMIHIPFRYLIVIFGFLFCAKPSNIIIKNIFNSFAISVPPQSTMKGDEENNELPNAGKLIGIMERFLVFSLILVDQYSAVGLIIAAKSILRFKDNTKNEYVLVGTLLSFGIAVMLGISVKAMWLGIKPDEVFNL